MAPSDARVLNGGSLIEFSTLYIERRVPPYDSSLGVFSLPPFSFSWSWKTGTNLFHGVGRFSYSTAHAFQNFGFGQSPSFKYKRLAISSRTVQLLEFCRVELGATSTKSSPSGSVWDWQRRWSDCSWWFNRQSSVTQDPNVPIMGSIVGCCSAASKLTLDRPDAATEHQDEQFMESPIFKRPVSGNI